MQSNRAAIIVLSFTLLVSPFVVSAQSVDTSALIASLLAQVVVLQQKIVTLTQRGSGGNAGGVSAACTITRTLTLGSRGVDVSCLQQYLITQNLLASDSATGYFGRLTQAAVIALQRANNLEQVGIVGKLTRAIINTSRAAQTQATSTPPAPSIPIIPQVSYGGGAPSVPPPPAPSVCTPLPPQTQTLSCPAGQTGSIAQTRASSCPGPAWSEWTTTSSTCAAPASCIFNGQSIPSGSSVTAYKYPFVAYGKQCDSEARACTNGILSGSFTYTTCAVSVILPPPPNTFNILVDTNFLDGDPKFPNESAQALQFAADGASSVQVNSPCGWQHPDGPCTNWTQTLGALNAAAWTISEGLVAWTGGPIGVYDWVDIASTTQATGRMVDAAMLYTEGDPIQILSDAQIAQYASKVVPGFGPLGARIVVLTRSYADGDPRQAALNHALQNSNVSGVMFETSPNQWIIPYLKLADACKYALSLGKKCYVLLPPGNDDGTLSIAGAATTNYLGDIRQFMQYLAESGGILNNSNTYIVLATYNRPNTLHYVSSTTNDPDSIQAAVNWLKSYRANPSSVKPLPSDSNRSPSGWLDAANCSIVGGWSQDPDTPSWPTYVGIYIDGKSATNVYAHQYRSDLCTAIGSCNHAFSWTIPAQYRDGASHTIDAYGVNTTNPSVYNAELSGSPKTFQCSQ